jgi:tetratricopeptide (TPR) repeat protein
MNPGELDPQLHGRIRDFCARGDAFAEEKKFDEAFYCYRDALDLVPEPAENWEATTWIIASIGDLYFADGNFEKGLRAFEDAVRCPGGLGNPFIHVRLGQCAFELGQEDRAADELTRAYMEEGREIFDPENPKYFQFLKTRIKI